MIETKAKNKYSVRMIETKAKNKKGFGWKCRHERIYGSFPPDNENCQSVSKRPFATAAAAASAGLRTHRCHADSVFVFSYRNGFVGSAIGINFNA